MKRICPHCGELVDKGATCPCRVAKRKAADEARGSAAERGYDKEWQRLRARFIAAYPTCALCGEAAQHVDHIRTIREAPWLRLEPSNLRSLCHSCHSRHTATSLPFGASA